MRPGTGKTIVSLTVLARAHSKKPITCLITAAKSKLSIWPRQIPQHLSIDYKLFTSIEALEKARNKQEIESLGNNTLYILLLSSGSLDARKSKIADLGVNFMILDEAHDLKNRKSKAAKAAAYISKKIERVLIMTGTPRGNIDIDLYSQINIMDHTIFGPWKDFEKEYTESCGFEGRKHRIKKSKYPLFIQKISNKAFFMGEYEANKELKQELEEVISIKLTGYAKRHYEEVESRLATEFKGMVVRDDLGATCIFRLQQLCGGFLKVEDDLIQLEQDKLIALCKLLIQLGNNEKVVIFARYLAEIGIICKALNKLGRTYGVIKGGSNSKIWYDFQDKKDPSTMVCQIKSGGTAIDLFAARYGIYYSNTYSYIDFDQSKKRLNRRGQTKQVKFFHLIVENSIDIDIRNSLRKKGQDALAILNQLRRRQMSKVTAKKKVKDETEEAPKKKVAVKKEKTEDAPKKETEGYGVAYLAESLGVEPFTIRQKLRKAKVEKNGKSYSWKTKKEADEVAKTLKSVKLKNEE